MIIGYEVSELWGGVEEIALSHWNNSLYHLTSREVFGERSRL